MALAALLRCLACQPNNAGIEIIRGDNGNVPVNVTCTPGVNCAAIVCGNRVCDAGESCLNCPQDCHSASGPCQRVGVVYDVWHQPTAYASALAAQQNSPFLTMEDVLRSRQEVLRANTLGYAFADVVSNPNVAQASGNFYYQYQPRDGYYCIYHHRSADELNYNGVTDTSGAYDCPNYQAQLLKHANELRAAGIDHVIVDMSRAASYSSAWDIAQLRPFEVLVQEWTRLRAAGVATPDIAVWHLLPAAGAEGASMVPLVMNIYNDAQYDPIFLRDSSTGRKVWFYRSDTPPDPNAIATIEQNNGRNDMITVPMWVGQQADEAWSLFSYCHTQVMFDDTPCAQNPTFNSRIGSQLAVSPSYQTGYASEPLQASGVYGGMTLRKQFAQAFNVRPDYLLLSRWNEQIALPGPSTSGPSMGLENDPTAGDAAFVGLYGVEFAADIEPSVEYGSLLYDIAQSCLELYRAGMTSCADPNALCCQGGQFSDTYTFYQGAQGTFGLYVANPNNDRSPLYLCVSGTTDFFLSHESACEMQTAVQTLGFTAPTKGGETLRTLRRCLDGNGHVYSLTGACPTGFGEEQILGYVR